MFRQLTNYFCYHRQTKALRLGNRRLISTEDLKAVTESTAVTASSKTTAEGVEGSDTPVSYEDVAKAAYRIRNSIKRTACER